MKIHQLLYPGQKLEGVLLRKARRRQDAEEQFDQSKKICTGGIKKGD